MIKRESEREREKVIRKRENDSERQGGREKKYVNISSYGRTMTHCFSTFTAACNSEKHDEYWYHRTLFWWHGGGVTSPSRTAWI